MIPLGYCWIHMLRFMSVKHVLVLIRIFFLFDLQFYLPYLYQCFLPSALETETLFIIQAIIRRGEFGVLGPEGNCWPQMACMVPSSDNEVHKEYWSCFLRKLSFLLLFYLRNNNRISKLHDLSVLSTMQHNLLLGVIQLFLPFFFSSESNQGNIGCMKLIHQ